ncbi:HAD family phosphatase [Vibrio sp. CAU 1672]|uniref:HAD family hydrolase n=1 Tax=Vibrio sp. CAU 1672 TaxID=3032594 RepID=UPI0023D9B853|nr:HAD family phosphatase [Vibrio sp. CAU 1672]MDF2155738.1 HAD family phosphatase [Vibrio sp. CAU 1672]
MNIKAVLFDMDGLIFDTEGLYKKSWQRAVSEQGLALTDEYYQNFIGVQDANCERLLELEFGDQLNMEQFIRVRDAMLKAERENGVAYKSGFKELFAELKQNNVKCALVTSSALPQVHHHFADTNYLEMFDVIVTAEHVKNGKPAPDCYRMATEQLGLAPAECLVLEDSNNGMRAGLAAGCHAIMIPDLLEPDADVTKHATSVLGSLTEVKPFVQANART